MTKETDTGTENGSQHSSLAAPDSESAAPKPDPTAREPEPAAPEAAPDARRTGSISLDLCAKSPRSDTQVQEPSRELLDQFYSTLRVMYLAAEPYPGPGEPLAEQHVRIRCLLSANDPNWTDAYEIEQLLTFVMTEEQLKAELPRRLAEAKELNLQFAGELAKQLDAIAEEEKSATTDAARATVQAVKRCILQRLLNDLQWFYNQRMRRRDAAKRLSQRVSALFLSAFLFFVALLFVRYDAFPVPGSESGARVESDAKTETVEKAESDAKAESGSVSESDKTFDSGTAPASGTASEPEPTPGPIRQPDTG